MLGPPMQAPLQATGNFGDLRDGRFHAGIDYSTFGKVGRPVFAVADGWVWRVRASGQGYGRSIYLQLNDGRFAVYGHLSRYASKIDAYVWQRQDSSGEYEQDLQPKPGELAFKRGDIIGWSGESGDGPPHLHFEIRRGDMNLHPFLFGYVHPDTKAPSIAAVRIAPAAANARVAGAGDPVSVKLEPGKSTRGPEVRGPFTISVDTGDWADGRTTRKATYALRAWVDGGLAFEAVMDSFSWDDMPEAEYVYDLTVRRPQADDLRPLNAPPTLHSGVVRHAQPWFDLSAGEHTIEIEAQDEAGNSTRRSFALNATPAPPSAPAAHVPGDTVFVARESSPETRLEPGGKAFRIVQGPREERASSFEIGFDPDAVYAPSTIRTRLDMPARVPKDLHDPFDVEITSEPWHLLTAVDVSPSSVVLRKPVRVALAPLALDPGVQAETRGRGLYLYRNGDWSFLSSARDSLGRYVATTRRLGTFAVLADTTAPAIALSGKRTYVAKAGTPPPPLAARVSDGGSGIAIRDARIEVDGRKVPAEFSQEEKTLTWRPRKALARGKHFAQISAVDRAGNRSSVVVPFEVR